MAEADSKEHHEGGSDSTLHGYTRRVWMTASIAGLIAVAIFILWRASDVLLLGFAGILAAILLTTLSGFVSRLTGLSARWSLPVVLLLLVISVVLVSLLMAPTVTEQFQELSTRLPREVQRLQSQLEETQGGRWLLRSLPDLGQGASQQQGEGGGPQSDGAQPQGAAQSGGGGTRMTRFVSTTLGGAVNLVVIFFVALYVAARPQHHLDGLLRLVPASRRQRAREVLTSTGETLRYWLLGQLISMTVTAVLTWIVLSLLGVPLALALGLLAGLLGFIPNFGPIIAGIPAVLLALAEDPMMAVYVVVAYTGVQMAEGYIVTPLVQRRMVDLAPSLIIMSQVLFGVLAGAMGVILAVPLLVAITVLVKMLYIEDTLGERLEQ